MAEPYLTTAGIFSRDAAGYDDLRRKLIPCFADFYGTALELIDRWHSEDDFRVLDIGAGTGLFSSMLIAKYPSARMRLLDASTGMIEQAQTRFTSEPGVQFQVADATESDLDGPWDLVISALAIHHLTDENKRRLYSNIFGALRDGGLFVNAEQVSGPEPSVDQRYEEIWLEQVAALGAPPHEVAKAQERMSHDRCAPLEEQLSWLREIGFSEVDCNFKAWRFAVFSGRKSQRP